jgi:hypothetical protein
MTGTDIAVRAANAIKRAAKKVDNEIARESRRQAESQDGTTISVATKVSTLTPEMPLRPENSPPGPGSPESLLTLEELLGLPNQEVVSVEEEEEEEEEDVGLEGLFWLPPDPEGHSDTVPPSASAPEPRRSKRMLSVAGYYAALSGESPRKARK